MLGADNRDFAHHDECPESRKENSYTGKQGRAAGNKARGHAKIRILSKPAPPGDWTPVIQLFVRTCIHNDLRDRGVFLSTSVTNETKTASSIPHFLSAYPDKSWLELDQETLIKSHDWMAEIVCF